VERIQASEADTPGPAKLPRKALEAADIARDSVVLIVPTKHAASTHQGGGRPSPCKTRFRWDGYPFPGLDLHPLGPLDEFQKALDRFPPLVTAFPGRDHPSPPWTAVRPGTSSNFSLSRTP
jgi:hypothetical protein